MDAHDDDKREPEPLDPDEVEDTGFTGGGGPASVIYGDAEKDKADEIGKEMLEAPEEND